MMEAHRNSPIGRMQARIVADPGCADELIAEIDAALADSTLSTTSRMTWGQARTEFLEIKQAFESLTGDS